MDSCRKSRKYRVHGVAVGIVRVSMGNCVLFALIYSFDIFALIYSGIKWQRGVAEQGEIRVLHEADKKRNWEQGMVEKSEKGRVA